MKQHIGWLYVSMNNLPLMGIVKGIGDLRPVSYHFSHQEWRTLEDIL
jgi:hypothetical protein